MNTLQASLDRALVRGVGAQYVNEPVHVTPVWELEHCPRILRHIDARSNEPREGQGLRTHAGVAGWFNLDVFARGKHEVLLLLDTNRNQTDFWKDFIALVATCPTADGLRQAFYRRSEHGEKWLHSDGRDLKLRAGGDEVRLALHRMEWMRSPEMYARIHAAAKEGRMVAADANIYDRARLAQLRRWCDANGLEVTSIYASNIEDLNKDDLNTTALRLGYGVDAHHPVGGKTWLAKFTGKPAPVNALQAVLNRGEDVLRREGLLYTPKTDFYRNPLVRDEQALKQLANSEDCQIFHSSVSFRRPLYVIDGAWPIAEAKAARG